MPRQCYTTNRVITKVGSWQYATVEQQPNLDLVSCQLPKPLTAHCLSLERCVSKFDLKHVCVRESRFGFREIRGYAALIIIILIYYWRGCMVMVGKALQMCHLFLLDLLFAGDLNILNACFSCLCLQRYWLGPKKCHSTSSSFCSWQSQQLHCVSAIARA